MKGAVALSLKGNNLEQLLPIRPRQDVIAVVTERAPHSGPFDLVFGNDVGVCDGLSNPVWDHVRVSIDDVLHYDDSGSLVSCNLDLMNPRGAEALEHLPPEQLADDILAKERRIIEIMEEIKTELAEANA